ncbi:MAG: chromate transporter [Spirochaetaceae bacterium]|jgi:chromate transporter|nr:chromate transporter [Spirochaetaceae bacterium]
MNILLLAVEFFKIGLFSVGGGLATLPFLYRFAETHPLLDPAMIPDMLAVAESLPGAIGINLAIYTGFRCAGIPGALAAGAGLAAPSIIIILIIARMFAAFRENRAVQAAFTGLRPAAAGLLSAAFLLALRGSLWNAEAAAWRERIRLPECGIFLALFLLTRKIKLHPAIWIILAGTAGVLLT